MELRLEIRSAPSPHKVSYLQKSAIDLILMETITLITSLPQCHSRKFSDLDLIKKANPVFSKVQISSLMTQFIVSANILWNIVKREIVNNLFFGSATFSYCYYEYMYKIGAFLGKGQYLIGNELLTMRFQCLSLIFAAVATLGKYILQYNKRCGNIKCF